MILALIAFIWATQVAGDERSTLVKLQAGESAALEGGLFTAGFERVISDSRCPRTYQCMLAGEAVIRIWSEEPGTARAFHVLKGPSRTPQILSEKYSVEFIALDPYPEPGPKPRALVTATLVIHQRVK